MTDTPMTPAREQEIRTLDLLSLMSDRAAPVVSGHLAVLLAEVDRLRKALFEVSVQVSDRDWLHARVAMLESTPIDEAAELAEGQAQLDAMRADHPAPCRVPDSPDCTCPDEHPMDRALRLGATRIPEDLVIEICEATNTGRPTGWPAFYDRDSEVWELTCETHDGDSVMLPSASDMQPMLRRDVETHFGPLTKRMPR